MGRESHLVAWGLVAILLVVVLSGFGAALGYASTSPGSASSRQASGEAYETGVGVQSLTALILQKSKGYFGYAWDELPFVSHSSDGLIRGGQPGITVSDRVPLTENFSAPANYKGRYYSTASVTGASIAATHVVTITVPDSVLNMSRRQLKKNCAEDSRVLDLYEDYGVGAVNWACIQTCLDFARDNYREDTLVRIVLPAGSYEFGGVGDSVDEDLKVSLRIYSNTWLDMTAGTKLIHKSRSKCALRNGSTSDTLSGYQDGNIILDGGTWEGLTNSTSGHDEVAICHARGVVVRNVVFDGCYECHQLELIGVSDATVTGCTFENYRGATPKEALQLDIAGFASAAPFRENDYTVTKNVVIYGNVFQDGSRGLGTHHAYLGYKSSEVLVGANAFRSLRDEAMLLVGFDNVAVKDNTISDCGRAIAIAPALGAGTYSWTGKMFQACRNYAIEGNTVTTAEGGGAFGSALSFTGNAISGNEDGLENVRLSNNAVNGTQECLSLSHVSKATLVGGSFKASAADCATVEGSSDISLSKASFTSSHGTGLVVRSTSPVVLSGCSFNGSSARGLYCADVTLKAKKCTFNENGTQGVYAKRTSISLDRCKVNDNAAIGMRVCKKSELVAKKCRILDNSSHGLMLSSSTAKVKSSKLKSNDGCGLKAKGTASVLALSKDTISGNGSHGVMLSGTTTTIKSSKLKSNYGCGLKVKHATSVLTLSKDTISGNGFHGAMLSGTTAKVKSSKLKSNGGCGLKATRASYISSLKNSALSGNHGDGLMLSGSTAKVKSSKLKSNDGCGLKVTRVSTILSLKKSLLSKNGKYGTFVSGGSTLKANRGNKMNANARGALRFT